MIGLLLKMILAIAIGLGVGAAFGAAFSSGKDTESIYRNTNGAGVDDGLYDNFLMPRDALSIARGDDPLDPESQFGSITDPLDLW